MRPSRDEWAMKLAIVTSEQSTCARRAVGCVLLNAKGHVLAPGYNGVASGMPHCDEVVRVPIYHTDPRVLDLGDAWQFNQVRTLKLLQMDETIGQCVGFEHGRPHACSGANSPSGTNLDSCQAIHAEQNALLQCKDVYDIDTCYVTTSPCITCTKLLMNTSCRRIVYIEEYPHTAAKELWVRSGRVWERSSIKSLKLGLQG
jgi:dCMP deaminase